ncbi:MAG: hypothetical protein ACXABY_19260 [Candidatus Thorarchaeota archaeon]|jgi:hypothetical protein
MSQANLSAQRETYMGLGHPGYPGEAVEFLSTASTVVTLNYSQQGNLLIFNGQTSASRIRLPQPAAGMVYNILFTGAGGVTTAHKICSTVGGSKIQCAGTTANAVANETTAQIGVGIQLIGLNDTLWLASRFGGSTLNINSTST